jgi:hypothetical protein
MNVINVSNLNASEFDKIESVISSHNQLLDVLNCVEIEKEKRLSPEIVTQDEYTHDIVVEWKEPIYLVYDTN